jgi:TolB-like protein/tetratricopeptide (TPR) repeat protein
VSSIAVMRLLKELRRRRVFRVAGLYVVGVWLLMQAANMLFPAWGIPDAAMRFLLWAGLLGFPVALAFGWVFDISTEGIRRTQPVGSEEELLRSMPLRRLDYVVLTAFLVVVAAIVVDTTGRVMQTATVTGVEEWRPSAAEIEPHSVAVLPFASLSSDAEHEYFADGISEEILNRLAAFRELKVIARTSSFVFKDSGYDIGRISGLLAVNYLLQGSVRRDGQQLRISAQLVDRAGVQVWSETFDRELQAIFSLQDEIAEAVATSIVPQIAPPAPIVHEPGFEAYQQYLIGRDLITRRPSMFWRDSAEHFTRAIELDPEYADAYAARAIGARWASIWVENAEEVLEKAWRDTETALALNPDLGLTYAVQALIMYQWKPGAHAEREVLLRRAVDLDPNLVEAWNWLAGAVSAQGRVEEAEEIQRRALRIDPLHAMININAAMNAARRGDFAAAERRLLPLLELPQPSIFVANYVADLHRAQGRLVDAVQMGKRGQLFTMPVTGKVVAPYMLAGPYAMLGMTDQAAHWWARWQADWPESKTTGLAVTFSSAIRAGALDYQSALARIDSDLAAAGLDLEALSAEFRTDYGILLALAGDGARAIQRLGPMVDPTVARQGFNEEISVRHALALAWQRTGQGSKAAGMLALLDAHFQAEREAGRLHLSDDLFDYARNAALLGEPQRALELLEDAIEAGWRGYYGLLPDPRWEAVRGEPGFEVLLARVKADIDVQRARMEEIDATDDFEARLDAAIEAKAAADARAGTLQ